MLVVARFSSSSQHTTLHHQSHGTGEVLRHKKQKVTRILELVTKRRGRVVTSYIKKKISNTNICAGISNSYRFLLFSFVVLKNFIVMFT